MKRDLAKRSAANRKAWRTRKRMAKQRIKHLEMFADTDRLNRIAQEWVDRYRQEARQAEAEIPTPPKLIPGHNVWPAYMTRALPNPWSKDLPPW